MNNTVISVENISKEYHLGTIGHGTLRQDIQSWWARMSGKEDPNTRIDASTSDQSNNNSSFWALKDVSFDVEQGEVLGIIGRNGAGKSTLLKIISRITTPTTGTIKIKGRIASLLEVGTGFHPELTGRENIYLNGTILGMKKREIDAKFDEIVKFAEVETFIDTPVKRYSSGMYVRLAFAVAAHLEPEILIIDEVLAVGDAAFQNKCLGKMGEVAKGGRTVLFVSHNMGAVASLCKSAILLNEGMVKSVDSAQKVIETYLTIFGKNYINRNLKTTNIRSGSGEVRIIEAAIMDKTGNQCYSFKYGEDILFEFSIEPISSSPFLICVVWIHTATGVPVLHLASTDDSTWKPLQPNGKTTIRCMLKDCKLYPGIYSVSFWIGPSHYQDIDFVTDALKFSMKQGKLLCRGFDMNWNQGIFHSESYWYVKEK